ncbi:MAG: CapA family protein, partial [Proteobacteria bacterium]|nr:CapA family protein [Pseudomonadota bacterium]
RGEFWDKGERRPYLYRGRPELLDILTTAGFDLVVMGNNHAMDYGPEALLEQMEIIEAIGMAQVGAGRNLEEAGRPTYMQVDDVIVAFIGLLDMLPKFAATADRPGVHYAEGNAQILAAMKEPIAQARKHADVVVFSPHWGGNWTDNPSEDRIPLAHALIDMGVDAILGHSSHHLHGVEIYKGKPIVYDMGSFFFDTVGQDRMRYSAGFLLDFDKQGFKRLRIYPVRLYANRSELARGADLEKIQKLIKKLSKELAPDLEWKMQDDGAMVLDFLPETSLPQRTARPGKLYQTGRTAILPDHIRRRKTDVVLNSPPPWA